METQFENIETTTVKSEDILDALMALHIKYPAYAVDIWVLCDSLGKMEYVAVARPPKSSNQYSCHSPIPSGAVKDLIKQIGDYDPGKERLEKITKLREELRKLEEEGRAV